MVAVERPVFPEIQNKQFYVYAYYIRNAESNYWKARLSHPGQFKVLEYLWKIKKKCSDRNT
jgi:hypothetical protein